MSLSVTIITSSIVFLLTLFLSKAIFLALAAVLIFLLASISFEAIWSVRKTPGFLKFIRPVINLFVSAGLGLSLYIIFFLSVEFFLTEIFFVIERIPSFIGTTFLLLTVVSFSFINWQNILRRKQPWFLFIVFIFFCSGVYLVYRKEKLTRERLPKIYNLSLKSGYQGEQFEIKGINFGPTFKKGQVFIGNQEITIVDWSEKMVTLELPVPNKIGKFPLRLVRQDGGGSNSIMFNVLDPKNLP